MPLQTGDKAPFFEAIDINGKIQSITNGGQNPTLLSFHRHAGCPPCNLRVREYMLAKQELDRYGVRLLSVFESPAESIRRDLVHGDVPFPILPDRDRRLYELYSVTPSFSGFLRSFLIKPWYSIQAIFKYGYRPKFAEVTTMMPAEFLIAPNGKILMARYAKDFGDYLSLSDIYQTLDKL